jgi:hypothetical protein
MKIKKVGDRICVKYVNEDGNFFKEFGILKEVRETQGVCLVRLDNWSHDCWFYRTQLFSVKPRYEPKEVWINASKDGYGRVAYDTKEDAGNGTKVRVWQIKFREVIERKK